MTTLLLASQSVYRKQLLVDAGFTVFTLATGVPEPEPELFATVELGLIYLAQLKALTAVDRLPHEVNQPPIGFVLGCDTVGCCAGKVLQKPADRMEAERMLRMISGTDHDVLTGWCLVRVRDRLLISGVERTAVTMRPWTEAERTAYLDSGEWEGKCGAYGLQLPTDPFVTRMTGSAANVIGVPVERVRTVLAEMVANSNVPLEERR